jgi:hypothetical protein
MIGQVLKIIISFITYIDADVTSETFIDFHRLQDFKNNILLASQNRMFCKTLSTFQFDKQLRHMYFYSVITED